MNSGRKFQFSCLFYLLSGCHGHYDLNSVRTIMNYDSKLCGRLKKLRGNPLENKK